MRLVVDANIAISSMVAGKITDLLLSPKLDVVAPELLFVEIEKHKNEIKNKSRLTPDEVEILISLLEKKIRIFNMEEFISFVPKAIELLGEHKKLFKDIGSVRSLVTAEVAELLKSIK